MSLNRIDIKMLHSKELRELRDMVKKELDFRADVGSEIENKEAWMSSTEWSEKVQEINTAEERERSYAYIEESSTNIALGNFDDLNNKIKEAQQQDHPQKTTIGRMESMRDWNRSK